MSETQKQVAAPAVKVQTLITLTARLAQLLAEEVDWLTQMQVSKIEGLQSEKLFLVNALDAQRKLLDKHPELIHSMSVQDKQDLQQVVDVFNNVLAENHRKLLLAKEVNQKIVQAITDVVMKNTRRMAYNGKGATGAAPFEILSVTLNKRV